MMKVTFGKIIDDFLYDTGIVGKKNPISQAGIIDKSSVEKLDIITGAADVNVLIHDKPFIDIILETFENGPQLKMSHGDDSALIETFGGNNTWMLGLNHPHLCLHIRVPLNLAKSWNIKTGSGDVKIPEMRTNTFQFATGSGDMELYNIKANELKLHTASGDMTCHGIVADTLRASTTSGDLELRKVRGDHVSSVSTSGDIRINDTYSGKFTARTVSGDVEIEDVQADNMELACTSGDIDAENIEANNTFLKTISGDVDYEYVNDCSMQGNTTSGDITLICKNTEPNATINFHTRTGDVHTNLQGSIYQQSNRHLSSRVGNGGHQIQLESTSGDLELLYR